LEFKARAKKIVSYFEMSIRNKEQKECEFELAFESKQYKPVISFYFLEW